MIRAAPKVDSSTGEAVILRTSILLADDHAILRQGLAVLIEMQSDLEVVGLASGGSEAVEMAMTLQPRVVVLDVSMPDMSGAEAAKQIRNTNPQIFVLALTRHDDQGYMRRMLQAGATGYVTKRAAPEILVDAIRIVAKGGVYVDPALAAAAITGGRRRFTPGDPVPSASLPLLSHREEQVLRLIAWGKSNKEVGSQLGISVKTAEFYKASAVEKLGLRSRTDILRYALAQNWLIVDGAPD